MRLESKFVFTVWGIFATGLGMSWVTGVFDNPDKQAQEARERAAVTPLQNGDQRYLLCREQFRAARESGAKLPKLDLQDITYDRDKRTCSTQGGTFTWQTENSVLLYGLR